MNRDARLDHHRLEERDDMNQEIKFLKDKIKILKYREEDMEDEIGDLEYKNEKLEKELHNL
jgi:prefoldin subunit 5